VRACPMLNHELHGTSGKPRVVLLHGFMGGVRDWDGIVPILKNDYCCLLVDLPGHGNSLDVTDDAYTLPGAAREVAQVMETAGTAPAAVIGYSMGGRLALYLALHHRHLCSRLVLESATAGMREATARAERQALDKKRAKELEQGEFEEFLRTWYSQPLFASLTSTPRILESVMKKRRLNDPRLLAKALRGLGVATQHPLWEDLPALAVPALCITGERDEKYSRILRQMASMMPRGDFEIVAGAGHNVHVENPLGFVERITSFLRKE
jgi:2-succinyl-6-hydroxy-2,4-cyclohexadiene-1-carboxylate synthase